MMRPYYQGESMHDSQIVKVPLGSLRISDNIQFQGHIYTVTRVDIHDDDTHATVKVGYPRVLDVNYERVEEITGNAMTPIRTYRQ
jgi:hypothetical protein